MVRLLDLSFIEFNFLNHNFLFTSDFFLLFVAAGSCCFLIEFV